MEYDRFATDLAVAYQAFADALTALLLRARLAGGLDPRAMQQLQIEAHHLANQFVRSADAQTSSYLVATVGGTFTDPAATERGAALMRALRNISLDGVMALTRRLRGAGLKTVMGEPLGAIARLMRQAEERLDLNSYDSAGRRWRSAALARFLARDFAYQLALDAQAARLTATAGDLAQVSYADPTHDGHGLVISLSGLAAGYPSLADVRARIFHPNASAQLTHVRAE